MSWADSGNTVTIVNSTIAHNDGGTRAASDGGGLLPASSGGPSRSRIRSSRSTRSITLRPGVLRRNCDKKAPAIITLLGHNLETGTDCGFKSTGDLQNTSPQFWPRPVRWTTGGTRTRSRSLAGQPGRWTPFLPARPGCGGTDQRDLARPAGQRLRHRSVGGPPTRRREASSPARSPPPPSRSTPGNPRSRSPGATLPCLGRDHRRTRRAPRVRGTHTTPKKAQPTRSPSPGPTTAATRTRTISRCEVRVLDAPLS